MKKVFFYVLVTAAVFIGCSDDDTNNNTLTQLVGTWKSVSGTLNGVEQSLDECAIQSTMTFTANGGYAASVYSINDVGDGCDHYTTNGSWANSGNNFTLTVPAGSETYLAEFPDENTLKITDTNEPGYIAVNILTRVE